MVLEDLIEIFRALDSKNVDYVLVGGVAVGLRGIERATNDVDLFVDTTEENIGRLRAALLTVFDDPSIEEILYEDLAGEYPIVRYGPPKGDFFIDIIGRLGSAVGFGDLEADEMQISGITVNVATPRTLYLMKRDTVRPVDQIDAANLREKYGLEED